MSRSPPSSHVIWYLGKRDFKPKTKQKLQQPHATLNFSMVDIFFIKNENYRNRIRILCLSVTSPADFRVASHIASLQSQAATPSVLTSLCLDKANSLSQCKNTFWWKHYEMLHPQTFCEISSPSLPITQGHSSSLDKGVIQKILAKWSAGDSRHIWSFTWRPPNKAAVLQALDTGLIPGQKSLPKFQKLQQQWILAYSSCLAF